MLSNKYNYKEDEPIIKKARKPRVNKIKEVKEVDEPEVYKMIRETREARNKGPYNILDEDDEDDEDADENKKEACIPTHAPLSTARIIGSSGPKKPGNLALNAFHPLSLKTPYDEKFINTLKTENDELKKHVKDLRQLHSFNDRLNYINHNAHKMKIKLSSF